MITPTLSPSSISCVIPVFNEASSIAATLKGTSEALTNCGIEHEIIVVDDGSTDGSGVEAEKSEFQCQIFRHSVNRGYGAAIKSGIRAAKHDWIMILDADSTYPPEEIPKLIEALRKNTSIRMIVGQREQTLQTDGPFRLMGKAILRRTANFLSGRKIPDLNSGFRLLRKEDAERYWPLLPDGFSLTTSITLALLCSGMEVSYVPIEYRRRTGHSKIRPIRDMTGFIALILRTITYFNPLKVYLPLSAIFIMAAFATVIGSKLVTHEVMDVTGLFLFIAGLQMLLIGVIADLILKTIGMRK